MAEQRFLFDAEPQLTDEIRSYLWPFLNDNEPQTLQDVGFDLNIPPEMRYLFVSPSDDSTHSALKEADKGGEPMPQTIQLQPETNASNEASNVNLSSEEPNQVEDGSDVIYGVSEQTSDVGHSSQEPIVIQESVGDGLGETSVAANPMNTRGSDDYSWMPEGWVKTENKRPPTGKFPGYVDKKYLAPGVTRPFRSKKAALEYIEKLKNM